mmetsp:Transcript_6207/g.7860  ORF Transcript_6207/g.7860 Transcript_6207/m.7860 type:complete len:345 (-) Transcript_6207:67-1101(-)
MNHSNEWICLRDKKSFSRLLYTNPVCLLTTNNCNSYQHTNQKNQSTSTSSCTATSTTTKLTTNSSVANASKECQNLNITPKRNVMVISWLTPTNNEGKFMMSINKRRHTASILLRRPNIEFVLCVPVAGMEEMILNVGKTSGRWGTSKFSSDHHHSHVCSSPTRSIEGSTCSINSSVDTNVTNNVGDEKDNESEFDSKSIKKRYKQIRFANGIVGLEAVKIGTSNNVIQNESNDSNFAIKGTVAHMKCRVYGVPILPDQEEVDKANKASTNNAIDDDHILIVAEIYEAHVHSNYWDRKKQRFVPREAIAATDKNNDGTDDSTKASPPYLTFFGTQSFGYVLSSW